MAIAVFVRNAITLLAGGVIYGLPVEPYFIFAELLIIPGAIVLVLLMRCIPYRTTDGPATGLFGKNRFCQRIRF